MFHALLFLSIHCRIQNCRSHLSSFPIYTKRIMFTPLFLKKLWNYNFLILPLLFCFILSCFWNILFFIIYCIYFSKNNCLKWYIISFLLLLLPRLHYVFYIISAVCSCFHNFNPFLRQKALTFLFFSYIMNMILGKDLRDYSSIVFGNVFW